MSLGTGIEWTQATWNPVRLVPELLDLPLRWERPRTIFVNSMSDLFHERLPDEAIDRIFAVMALTPRHTYQVLTKRPERMRAYMDGLDEEGRKRSHVVGLAVLEITLDRYSPHAKAGKGVYLVGDGELKNWPLTNVWPGVSVENQAAANERIPLLLETPAAVRFLSVEPLLGPVDLGRYGWLSGCDACCNGDRCPGPPECTRFDRRSCPVCKGTARGVNLDWVIVGGESGPGARPCEIAWIRSVRDQCRAAGVPCFIKQLGARPVCPVVPKGAQRAIDDEWPTGTRFWPTGDHPLNGRVALLRNRKGADPLEWPEDSESQGDSRSMSLPKHAPSENPSVPIRMRSGRWPST